MKYLLMAILAAAMATAAAAIPARAAQAPQIVITHPSEGETLYAGPSTLIYSVEVKGWVLGVDDLDAVALSLEVVRDSIVVGELDGTPASDGSFSFFVTVNPEGSKPNFTAPQVEAGCENCHVRSGLDLPDGGLVIRVSAGLPDGTRISQERRITVDRSGYAVVPVRVVRTDAPGEPAEGVVVEASSRMYQWRARLWSGTTDADGFVSIRVEALGQAPTRFVIKTLPSVHEGMLYEGVASDELVLPPASTSAPTIILEVRPRSGLITGRALNPDKAGLESVNVWAIHEGDLERHQATTNKAGSFVFWDLPIGSYIVAADPDDLADAGIQGEPVSIDLARSPRSRVTLSSHDLPGPIVDGAVFDESGDPIPISRITVEGADGASGSRLSSRTWWASAAELPTTIVVSAPGFYSRSVELGEGPVDGLPLEITLTRRPETASLGWGSGEIILPPEDQYTLTGKVIELQSGWVWGSGGGEAFTIRTSSLAIEIAAGSFAVELGSGSTGWLYVYDGFAVARPADGEAEVQVHAGEVVRFGAQGLTSPIPFSPILETALAGGSGLSIPQVWEPGPLQIQIGRLRNLGVSAAKIITLVTYSLGMLLLVLLPLSAISSLRRRR